MKSSPDWSPVTSFVPLAWSWSQYSLTSSLIVGVIYAEHTLSKVADATNLGEVDDTSEGCAAIHMDLNRLEKWSDRSLMKFNKGKDSVVHTEKNSPMHPYRLGLIIYQAAL